MKKITLTLILLLGLMLTFSKAQSSATLKLNPIEYSKVDIIADASKKINNSILSTTSKNNFEQFELMAVDLNQTELTSEINEISIRLDDFAHLNYDQFSDSQLKEFNTLSQKKAVFIKKLIFMKYSEKYAGKI